MGPGVRWADTGAETWRAVCLLRFVELRGVLQSPGSSLLSMPPSSVLCPERRVFPYLSLPLSSTHKSSDVKNHLFTKPCIFFQSPHVQGNASPETGAGCTKVMHHLRQGQVPLTHHKAPGVFAGEMRTTCMSRSVTLDSTGEHAKGSPFSDNT